MTGAAERDLDLAGQLRADGGGSGSDERVPVDAVRAYYDTVSSAYGSLHGEPVFEIENQRLRRLLLQSCDGGHGSCLDLGSGVGLGYDLVPWRDYLGIDLSGGMVEEARRRHPGVRFARGDMERLDLPDDSFDFVISLFGSFSHSLRPDLTAGEVVRVLRPGGVAVVMGYARLSLRNLVRAVRRRDAGSLATLRDFRLPALRRTSLTDIPTAPARYDTTAALRATFGALESPRVHGLNALVTEAGLARASRSPVARRALLALDRAVTSVVPDLGDALILIGRKPRRSGTSG